LASLFVVYEIYELFDYLSIWFIYHEVVDFWKKWHNLRPVSFYWKDGNDRDKKLGLVAQEVKEVVKETVIVGDDENQTLGLNYSELIPVLIKGMQEQQKQIETQQKEIYELKSLVNTLVANQNGQGNKWDINITR